MHLHQRTSAAAAALLTATLTLSGCGAAGPEASRPAGSSSAAQPHDAADVRFATQMIPHHVQAVSMARLAARRADSPAVQRLAQAIKDAQGPEISTMSGWLRAWGAEVPSTSGGMSGGSMSGMMSGAEMRRLGRTRGAAFDRMFLTLMIAHHRGAVAMAEKERAQGRSRDAVRLAGSIRSSQSAQIIRMRRLLTIGGASRG